MKKIVDLFKNKRANRIFVILFSRINLFFDRYIRSLKYYLIKIRFIKIKQEKINLCSGSILLKDYLNIDLYGADLCMDLEKHLLPFKNDSVNTLVCMSAINYFKRQRAEEIITDIFRVLKKGGIVRFSSQDLEAIAKKYVEKDTDFFFQKGSDGKDRFPGETFGEKFNSWFYGYSVAKNKGCKFFYDFETLSLIFKKVGFDTIERKKYLESNINNIEEIDNRQDQVFFLEAIK